MTILMRELVPSLNMRLIWFVYSFSTHTNNCPNWLTLFLFYFLTNSKAKTTSQLLFFPISFSVDCKCTFLPSSVITHERGNYYKWSAFSLFAPSFVLSFVYSLDSDSFFVCAFLPFIDCLTNRSFHFHHYASFYFETHIPSFPFYFFPWGCAVINILVMEGREAFQLTFLDLFCSVSFILKKCFFEEKNFFYLLQGSSCLM